MSPIIEIANPFTIHLGLLYINEDSGPIIELPCATNIIPAIISPNPTTSNTLSKIRFLIVMTTLLVNHSIINLKCHHSILYSTYIHSIEKNF